MKAERLYNKTGEWVGVSRHIKEYWAVGSDRWTFKPLDHDPERSETLTKLPKGIAGLGRKRISTRE